MGLNTGINVRLDSQLKQRLQFVADQSGIKVAQLIRMAVEEYCKRIESTGQVTIFLPSLQEEGATPLAPLHSEKISRSKGKK